MLLGNNRPARRFCAGMSDRQAAAMLRPSPANYWMRNTRVGSVTGTGYRNSRQRA
jgi:hypothetical protein